MVDHGYDVQLITREGGWLIIHNESDGITARRPHEIIRDVPGGVTGVGSSRLGSSPVLRPEVTTERLRFRL